MYSFNPDYRVTIGESIQMSNTLKSEMRMVRIKEMISARNKEEMKENLKRHFVSQKKEMHLLSKEVQAFIGTSKKGSLILPIPSAMDEVAFKMDELAEGLNQTFTLFIIGMGNYGKSTLINALLGEKLAPVSFLPKTWKIDVYDSNMPPGTCIIIYKDGKKEEKSLEETKRFIEQEEKKAFESDKLVTSELKKSISNLKSPEAVREAKEYLNKEFLYRSNVIEVRWPAKKNHLTERFHLVDTPGLVQNNLSGDTVMGLQKYYPKADGVLWMLDATKIASKQSKEMIDELEKSLEKVGGKTDNIIAVVNRMDAIRKNGGEQAVQAVLKDVHKIFGSYFNKILPISAKEAFDGILSNDTALVEQSGMLQLQNEIKTNFLKNARKIQLSSKITGYKQVVHQLTDPEHPIQKYINRLKADLSDFSKRQANIKKKYKEKKEAYEENLQDIIDEFESDLRVRVESNAETLFDLESEDSRKDYIKNQILKFDLLENELQSFVKYWKNDLNSTLKIMQKEAVFTEYKFIDPYKLVKNSEIISKASTKNLSIELSNGTIDTGELSVASGAGFAFVGAMILGPVGLLLGGITGALGINKGIAKFFKSGKLKRQLNEAAAEQLGNIQENILNEIEKLAQQGEKNVLQVLNATFQELHGKSKNNKNVQNVFREFYDCLKKPIVYPDFQMLLIDEYEKKIKG